MKNKPLSRCLTGSAKLGSNVLWCVCILSITLHSFFQSNILQNRCYILFHCHYWMMQNEYFDHFGSKNHFTHINSISASILILYFLLPIYFNKHWTIFNIRHYRTKIYCKDWVRMKEKPVYGCISRCAKLDSNVLR